MFVFPFTLISSVPLANGRGFQGSCGKQAALHCNCEKAATENKTAGARCSCSMSTIHHLPVEFTLTRRF